MVNSTVSFIPLSVLPVHHFNNNKYSRMGFKIAAFLERMSHWQLFLINIFIVNTVSCFTFEIDIDGSQIEEEVFNF